MSRVVIFLIKIYQKTFSKILPKNRCRFYPTCSQYSIEAFEAYGFIKGSVLTLIRLSKCHPLHGGGHDPVIKK
ncbi:MAG: membrane protein insertion efficiency factor YidD [Bacteroidetes bacterium]|nr:membrane protein insertion efficiency factor YidD [Bacteroidota bacterium]